MIHAAAPGDTVLVPAGTYREQVEIQRPVHLQAAGDGPVIIDGECKRESGISISTGHDITVSGIEIRNTTGPGVRIGNGPDDVPRPHNIIIENMVITDFNCKNAETQGFAGISAWYAGCCMTFSDNTITYRSSGDEHGYGDGIWFKSASDRPSGGGHVVSGNKITGGWDGIGGETETDPHGSFDGDSQIMGNSISGCWDDGVQVEGNDAGVHVAHNEIQGCGAGVALAAPVTGPLYVEDNNIHDLARGQLGGLYCFKVGNQGGGTAYLTQNRCSTAGDGIAQTNEDLSPLVSSGNCFDVSGYVFSLAGPFDGSSFDGDKIHSSDAERWAKWGDSVYNDLDVFRANTGFEANGAITESCP